MAWAPIEDLPENWRELASTELSALAQAWEETYTSLQNTSMVDRFNERLRREWSIETGIIERIYTIDRGTTQLLIEQGIDASLITHGATNRPVGEVIRIIKDQREALEGLFAFVARKEKLTLHYIRTLHQVLLRHQDSTEALDQFGNMSHIPLIKGDWKRLPNNPRRPDGVIHEYCPPEQVQVEMEKLIELHYSHLNKEISPEVEAAWLHHRFTQIHPFQDGNGRIARCLATLVLIRAGRFPLVINRDQWMEYITALEEADAGHLERLVQLFDQIEKSAYLKALGVSEELQQTNETVVDIISRIAEKYQKRQQIMYDRVFFAAVKLHDITKQVLDEYASLMQQRMSSLGLPILVQTRTSNDQTAHWYQDDIVYVAKKLNHYANLTKPRLWVRLRMENRERIVSANAEIVVSFYYLGKGNRRIMIATVFLNILHTASGAASGEEDASADTKPFRETRPLGTEGFIITHSDEDHAEQRQKEFRAWLDQAITIGLAEWERQL